ncbi:hypothetical protein PsorP6_013390 [Peronosclerospora sorghi]|uniref:Uncharacterized protein n=1 Tax=Peronosclerospora sorghi TaxID=230839 RepID=A0ACC0WHE8_9STRA|nr:hypothetical protein PsorP6_013390 [Peronosclerospora sorghi]
MEAELRDLNRKWAAQLLNQRTLTIAQRSAKGKHGVHQTEMAHAAVLRAPLYSNGQDMFEALHFNTHLWQDDEEREKQLLAHKERSVATLPSIVNNFTQMTRLWRPKTRTVRNLCYRSRKLISQDAKIALISSIFISEIPHTSLEDLDAAAMAYFDEIPTSMKRHFNVHADRVRLNHVDSSVLYRRSTFKGAGLPATVNNVVCSVLTPSHGVVHFDAIMDDPLHPINLSSPSQFGVCGMTVTPRKDTVTGQTVSGTLRWIVVYHCNLQPDDPALRDDLEIIRLILNGDLLTATICGYIQEQQHNSPR